MHCLYNSKMLLIYALFGALLSIVPKNCAAADFVVVLRAGENTRELTEVVQCTLSKGIVRTGNGLAWSRSLFLTVRGEDVNSLKDFTSEHSPGIIEVHIAGVKISKPRVPTAITDGRVELTIQNDEDYVKIRAILETLEKNNSESSD